MVTMRKFVAAIISFVLIFSMTSCSKTEPQEIISSKSDSQEVNSKSGPQDIINAVDVYAKSVQHLDGERLVNLTKGLDDRASARFKDHLDLSNLKYDDALVKRAFAESITYTIDESSIKVSGKNASCNVTFSIANPDKGPKKLVDNAEAYVQRIKDCQEKDTFTLTFAFEKDGGRWLASKDNLDLLEDLYSFLDAIYEFVPNTEKYITATSWLYSNKGNYENAYVIELDLWFDEHPEAILYYTVSKDGTELYKSNKTSFKDKLFRATFSKEQGAKTTDKGYIESGNYTIKVIRDDGHQVAEESTYVAVDDKKAPPVISKTWKGPSTTISDPSFAPIASTGWWNYDKTLISDGVYAKDTKKIGFAIKLLNSAPDVYYALYFIPGENADIKDLDYSKPVSEGKVSQAIYPDGTSYYNIDYAPQTTELGMYVLFIAKDKAAIKDSPYITAKCKVIDQDSKTFN